MRVHRSNQLYMRGSGGDHTIYSQDLAHVRGGGIGSIFSSIFSNVVPIVKKALGYGTKALKSNLSRKIMKDAKKTAVKAGLNVVGDALQGENVLHSTKKQIKKAKQSMGKKIKKRADNYVLQQSIKKKPAKAKNQPKKKSPPKVYATTVGSLRAQQSALRRRQMKKNRKQDIFD